MKVIFATNIPSPYRVDFFNELGRYCELTVLYERKKSSERDSKWTSERAKNYNEVYLDLKPVGVDRSRGAALKNYIKNAEFDFLILTNYVSPATVEAIMYCRVHKVPYYIEYDGGFNKRDSLPKLLLKKILLKGAKGHFTTADEHIKYLRSLGIKENVIYKYPFTSINKVDVVAHGISCEEKRSLRTELGITEEKVILSVGQFIPRKGFDVLINAMPYLDKSIGLYIVGGEPTEEYKEAIASLKLDNVHFVGFKTKTELREYYRVADVFAFPTREDIWGLVINEAMAQGLPVVSTDRCIAALEMVDDGENGYIVETENESELADGIRKVLCNGDYERLQLSAIEKANAYTIEKMVECHLEIFQRLIKKE